MIIKDIQKIKKSLACNECKSLPEMWDKLLDNYSGITAVMDSYNNIELTYGELYRTIRDFACGLQSLGVKKGSHISLFSENSSKWLISDQAVLMSGGVDALRGSQTPTEELVYILEHSDSIGLIAENFETINNILEYKTNIALDFIICLSDEKIDKELKENHNIYSFKEVIKFGKQRAFEKVEINRDDLATLVYTSGTTGKPKGVMINHGNFLCQLDGLTAPLPINAGDVSLNVLPTWHIYERTCEYYFLYSGVTMAYTNVANFKNDIKLYKPNYIAAVPRIWEAIYSGVLTEIKKQPLFKRKLIEFFLNVGEKHIKSGRIQNNLCIENINCSLIKRLKAFATYNLTSGIYALGKKLVYNKLQVAVGGALKQGISGGGALASHLEDFYETIGIEITVGYGLTETSPILTFRRTNFNLKCSVGKPVAGTELKIIDPETKEELGFLDTGVVMAKGPQVMKGYYKNSEATKQILSDDGWLNTGDLGWMTPWDDLILTGRNKDVIVLSNGENIEPQPLEDTCLKSSYINQIMLVGQDKAALGALISPNIDSIQKWAKKHSLNYADASHLYTCPKINKLFKKELSEHLKKRANFRPFEKVQKVKLIDEPFTIENGLMTRTMKIKKNEVQNKYKDLIEEMFKV